MISAFEQSPLAVALLDVDGVMIDANASFIALLGDVSGRRRWLAMVAPEAKSSEESRLGELSRLERAQSEDEVRVHRSGGETLVARVSRWRVPASASSAPQFAIAVRPLGGEDQRARDALSHLGAMAGMVAHEVRNPIAGLVGGLQIIRGALNEASSERDIIGVMIARLRSLDRTIEELLVFARPSSPDLAPAKMRALLSENARVLTLDPERAGINVEIAGEEVEIEADSDLLGCVFLNLMINAAQAMRGRGTIQVVASRARSDRGEDRCRIEVRDSGPGVPKEDRERIFEPFVTTKSKGTGLGLAIARRGVEAHGGTLELTESNVGAVFVVSLPIPSR